MADSDFSVKAIISAETSKFEKGMKQAQTSANNLSNTFGNLQKTIGKLFALGGITLGIKAITDFGKQAIKSAESANKSFNQLNNTIKVTGATAWTSTQEMVKLSEKIASSTNYTVGEIQDMQSVLLGFKNITGETFEEASNAITDMATVMGMDLRSAVQTVGKALDDPVKGLDSLRRQGFAFTEEQKAQLQQLVINGKQLEAQKIILDELATTYGGAAKAVQSGFDRQRDAVIKFKETLGNQLLPIMETWSNRNAELFGELTKWIEKVDFERIAVEFEIVLDAIKQVFSSVYENVVELFKNLGMEFDSAEEMLEHFRNWFWKSFNDVYLIFQDVFGSINAILKGDWKTAWEYAKLAMLRVIKAILESINKVISLMPNLANSVIEGYNTILKAQDKLLIDILHLPEFFRSAKLPTYKGEDLIDTSSVEQAIEKTRNVIEQNTGKAADKVLQNLDNVSERREKYQKKEVEGYKKTTGETIKFDENKNKKITEWDKKLIEQRMNGLKEWSKKYHDLIKEQIEAERETALQKADNAEDIEKINRYYNKAQENENKRFFKAQFERIKEYAKKAVEIMKSLAGGVKTAFSAFMKLVDVNFDEMIDNMLVAGDKILTFFVDTLPQLPQKIGTLVNGFFQIINTVTDYIAEHGEELQQIILDLVNTVVDAVVNFIQNGGLQKLVQGVVTLFVGIINAIAENLDKIVDAILDALPVILNGIVQLVKAVVENLDKIIPALVKLAVGLVTTLADLLSNDEFIDTLIEGIMKVIEILPREIIKNLPKIITAIVKVQAKIIEKLPDIIFGLMEVVLELLTDVNFWKDFAVDLIKALVTSLGYAVAGQAKMIAKIFKGLFYDLPKLMFDIGVDSMKGLIEGMKSFFTKIIDAIKGFFNKIINAVKNLLGIHSPSTVFKDIGINMIKGLWEGIKSMASWFADKFAQFWKAIFSGAVSAIQGIAGGVLSTISNIFGNILNILKSLFGAIKEVVQEIIDTLAKININLGDIFKSGWDWAVDTVTDIGATVSKAVSGAVSSIVSGAKSALGGVKKFFSGGFFATGTQSAPRGLAIVGEKGPELVRFNGGEQVINNHNTQKALNSAAAGKNITNNITFNNLQDTTAFAMIQQLKQYNRQLAINGIF